MMTDKFCIKFFAKHIQISESLQFTKIVGFCEMNETFYNWCVEKEYLA